MGNIITHTNIDEIYGNIYSKKQEFLNRYGFLASKEIEKICTFISKYNKLPRIIIMGLSGDPFHIQHENIVEEARKYFDIVIIILVYEHAFLSKKDMSPFDFRVAMVEKRYLEDEQVFVSIIEKELFGSSYLKEMGTEKASTIHIIKYLNFFFGDNIKFHFFLGKDTFKDILDGRWTGKHQILDLMTVIVCDREIPGCMLTPHELLDRYE